MDSQDEPALDRFLVSRLLLGALSEHEQRRLLLRLLRSDSGLRREITPFLKSFVAGVANVADVAGDAGESDHFDRFEEALEKGVEPQVARLSLLDRDSEAELEEIISAFTFQDLFALSAGSRRIFSWGMAELLLRRAQRADSDLPTRRTSYFLALMVVDVLEILVATNLLAAHPRAFADLRRRLGLLNAELRPSAP